MAMWNRTLSEIKYDKAKRIWDAFVTEGEDVLQPLLQPTLPAGMPERFRPKNIIDTWQRAGDKLAVDRMFYLATGLDFEDWLDSCIKILDSYEEDIA